MTETTEPSKGRRGWSTPLADVCADIVQGLGRTPLRTVLLMLGGFMASGLLAFSLVQADTGSEAVRARFADVAATTVTVELPHADAYRVLTQTQLRSIADIPGVTGVAFLVREPLMVRAEPERSLVSPDMWTLGGDPSVLKLRVRTPASLEGRSSSSSGEKDPTPDESQVSALTRGVYVGRGAPGANDLDGYEALRVGSEPESVGGWVEGNTVEPRLATAALRVSESSGLDLTSEGALYVRVRPGWAAHVAPRVEDVIDPNDPPSVAASYAAEAEELAGDVVAGVDTLAWLLAGAVLLLTSVMIGLAVLTRAVERKRLLGLRRALGASTRSLVVAMCGEASVIGLIGGVVGVSVGAAAAAFVLRHQNHLAVAGEKLATVVAVTVVVHALAAVGPAWLPPAQALRE